MTKERRTVLVVEDEPTVQKTLSAFLTQHGFEIISANDVEEALKILGREDVDAVTLDIRLPDTQDIRRNGLTFLNFLRATPEYERLPVVIFTGLPLSPKEEQHARQLGAEIFYKPEPYGALLEGLTRLLDPRR